MHLLHIRSYYSKKEKEQNMNSTEKIQLNKYLAQINAFYAVAFQKQF